jgi:cyclopropane fatty-acyl-phospholipid synthase-like methyltransferase|tara:strand:+ start:2552 stop:3106 length:555 start_codon:yes stop_codon:yes gene_type:complete
MLEEHLGGHGGLTHIDQGALTWLKSLGNKSYLDIGCGPGGMVELADSMGFKVLGIDGDYTLDRYNKDKFLIHDFAVGPVELNEIYDIGWSVEFVEHVEERFIPNYITAMQKCKALIMTHALEDQTGYHHVNCQNPPYWINKMSEYGFKLDEEKTNKLRIVSTMGKKKKHRFLEKTGMYFVNENL